MNFLNGSFKIGRLFGITIRIHILFVLWIAFQLIRSEDAEDFKFQLIFLGMLFGTVLVHEFGHCFGARAVEGDAENILLWPLGGLAYAHAPMTPWAQFVTVISGPLVNVGFCLACAAFLIFRTGVWNVVSINPLDIENVVNWTILAITRQPYWVRLVGVFYTVNLFLLAFNLLPIYPCDGGQLFQCLLWPFIGLHQAMLIACQVGLVGSVGLGIWGFNSDSNILIFIALFGGFTCWQRLQMLRYGMVADERVRYAPYKVINPRKKGLFARLFKLKSKPRLVMNEEPPEYDEEPDVSRQEAKQAEFEAEVDRILKKVHDSGLDSLSYIERRKLERASRERQRREAEMRQER